MPQAVSTIKDIYEVFVRSLSSLPKAVSTMNGLYVVFVRSCKVLQGPVSSLSSLPQAVSKKMVLFSDSISFGHFFDLIMGRIVW